MTAAFRVALLPWAISRLVVLATALVTSAIFGPPTRGVDPAVSSWIAQIGGWDTTWYLSVARQGYEHDVGQVGETFTNLAFFPVLPGVMAVGRAVGLNPFWFAILVCNLAFLGALALFGILGRQVVAAETARRSVWVLAFVPMSVYASMAYSEAIVLLCVAGAALLATRGRFALAGLVGAAAAISRPPGLLVAVLVGLIALNSNGAQTVRWRRAALGTVPAAIAFAGFLGWMQVARGSWRLPFEAQGAWSRGQIATGLFTALPDEIAAAVTQVVHLRASAQWTSGVRDLAALAGAVWLLQRLARQMGWRSPWVIFSLLAIALPIASGSVLSSARFSLLAIPLTWPLAEWVGPSVRRQRGYLVLAALGMVLLVAQLEMRSP